jgi:hypothetical protein
MTTGAFIAAPHSGHAARAPRRKRRRTRAIQFQMNLLTAVQQRL